MYRVHISYLVARVTPCLRSSHGVRDSYGVWLHALKVAHGHGD